MIRPLRARHRWMIAVLAVVVPVVFVLGLLARQPVPPLDQVTAAGRPPLPDDFVEVSTSDDAWGGLPVTTTWLRNGAEPPRRAVRLELREELRRPDLLVYWADGDGVPAGAFLLGPIGDRQVRAWVLPEEAGARGRLVLYSLARQQIVAESEAP